MTYYAHVSEELTFHANNDCQEHEDKICGDSQQVPTFLSAFDKEDSEKSAFRMLFCVLGEVSGDSCALKQIRILDNLDIAG